MHEKNNYQKSIIRYFESENQLDLFVSSKRNENKKNKTIVGTPHPFLKWAGGKRQLISQLDKFIPINYNKYIEPFVGGGALFFYLLPPNATLIDNNLKNLKIEYRDKFTKLELKNYIPLEINDLIKMKFDKGNIFIDEAYTWLESRTSSSTLNRYLSYIIFQSRKRTIDIYTTSQMFSSVDIRFREQSNIIIKCKRIKKGFHYWIYQVGKHNIKTFILPYENAKKYFDIYDTYEIIEPNQKQELEFKLIEKNPKHLFERVKKISEIIRDKVDNLKITHDSIKAYLLMNGFNTSYEKYVYLYLKEGLK